MARCLEGWVGGWLVAVVDALLCMNDNACFCKISGGVQLFGTKTDIGHQLTR